MKLTVIIMLAGLLQVSARTTAQTRISISLRAATLEKVFTEIEKRSGYTVFYNTEVLKAAGASLVSVSVKDATIEDVMQQCLKGLPLEFSVSDKTIFVKKGTRRAAIEPVVGPGSPVPSTFSGIVRTEAGAPLMGASVYVQKLQKTVVTDKDGEFTLKNVPDGEYEVLISYIGFEPYRTKVSVQNHEAWLGADLKQSMSNLDETVVKGYYSTTNRLNTGDVTTVKGEDIQKQPVSDPIQALEGRVPGLYISQTSGVPGAYGAISIRGQNSIANGNDPLYIVDGVPFSSVSLSSSFTSSGATGFGSPVSNSTGGPARAGGGLSPFNALDPADIENIVVLKDADATAIYGSRGANGVILITTKKGKAGKTKVDLNVYSGAGQVTRMMHLLNTKQYLEMRREAFANDSIPFPSIAADPGDYNYDINGAWDTSRYTNWQKVLIGNTVNFTNAEGSVSGGSANTQFIVGGGFNKQGTAFIGNYSDQKASAHFSLSHVSENKRFHLEIGANYVYDNSDLPPVDFTSSIAALAPDYPALYNKDGSLNWQIYNGSVTTPDNPAAATFRRFKAATNNLISNLSLAYQLLTGLQIKSSFGFNRDEMVQTQITPSTSAAPPFNTVTTSRQINLVNTDFNTWIIEPQLDYQHRFPLGKIEALVGSTFQEKDQNTFAQYANGFSNDALITDPAAGATKGIFGANYTLYHYNALYGRLSYNYNDKYLVNITARRDGSSRFGPGKQFGNFGAVGIGWIFSKENFIEKNLPFLSYGKIRGSYGTTGNDQIADYSFLSTYTPSSSTYQGINALTPTRITNPYLAWELVRKLEGGIELGFVRDRILVSASYFQNRTGNQLVGYALPGLAGLGSVQLNLPAIVQNTGWELTFTTVNIKSKNFTWSSSANISLPNNKLIAFPNLKNFGAYNTEYVVGKSIFIRELYHSNGVNSQTGLYQFETKNSDGVPTNPQDLVVTKPVTQKYYGGLDNSFSYKGFMLDVFFQYVNQTGYSYKNYFYTPGSVGANQPTVVLNRWTTPGENTSTQLYGTENGVANNTYGYYQQSDGIITGKSFLRLKNLAFSYQFSGSKLKAMHLQGLRIYVQGQNLLTVTKYVGLDPETSGFSLPPLRMLTGGIQVSL